MSMANPHSDPRDSRRTAEATRTLQLPLRPTNDHYITCVVCDQDGVEFEFFSRTSARRQFQGLHKRCAETIGPIVDVKTTRG
jgi:hypothetical protein